MFRKLWQTLFTKVNYDILNSFQLSLVCNAKAGNIVRVK